jgi:hypothetical protein
MKFLKNKKIIIEYSIYLFSTLLQILLVLASAKFLTADAFVTFNIYIAFINVFVIVINCTTHNYLLINNNDRLNPLIFENLLAILVLPIIIFLFFKDNSIIFYILLMVILRLNLNLYCRHYVVNNKVIQSLSYNFFGNSLWVIFAIAYYFVEKKLSINILFSIWIITLALTCIFYLIYNSIKIEFNKKNFIKYICFYFKNFHFSFMFPSFLNIERIIFFKIFNSVGLLSTYTVFSKMINLIYEVSFGFIATKKYGSNFKISNISLFFSIIFLNIIFFYFYNISYFNNFIVNLFSGKIYAAHEGILPFMIINLSFYGFLRLLYIDMVKNKKFTNLFYIVLAIYSSFILILFLKPSIHISLLIESFLIAIACLYSYHILKNESKISNK